MQSAVRGIEMIKSMTGFGRSETINEDRKIVVELKAVNHRYCDMNIKLPKKLFFLEASIRNFLKDYIERGKIDIFITYEDYTKSNVCVKYNREIAAEYVGYLKEMSEEFGLDADLKATAIGRFNEVFSLEERENNQELIWEHLKEVLEAAVAKFVETRITEGEHLKEDLLHKLDEMSGLVSVIEENSPKLIEEYKEKLTEKVAELMANNQIDSQRIATEVTLYADKICIDEEIVRLKSHITKTRDILINGGSVGRKLDFIAQEMNREANTILSKSNSLQISDIGIDLKTDIEKVREQIQNIE